MKNNQKGFSAVEGLLILVIAGLIGFIGWYVWHSKAQTDKTLNTAASISTSTQKSNTTNTADVAEFVNVVQDDNSIKQVAPDKIAKTVDQASMLTALHNTCTGKDTYVTISHIVFDGNSNFVQDGNYAEINAGRCNVKAKTLDDVGGSGIASYFHKNSSGKWVFDTGSQMAPDCTKVDGLGYPASIISYCYEGSTSRAPK